MYKETLNGNLITIEHWPASTIEIKGKFSRSFNSLCNKNMRSLSSFSSFYLVNYHSNSISSIYSSSDDIMQNFGISSQKFLLNHRKRRIKFELNDSILYTLKIFYIIYCRVLLIYII